MNNRYNRLVEVSILRPLAIFLVVFYHAFAIYDGKWKIPDGVTSSSIYDWMADISYSFMLPLFVLLSGYLFSFQLNEKRKQVTFWSLVKNKCIRLLVPCYIFGVIYILIVIRPESFDLAHIMLKLLGGVGHLWFLPMLFWCFIVSFLFHKYIKLRAWFILGICFILYLFGLKNLPLSIGYTCWYLIYFEIGYYLRCYTIKFPIKLKSFTIYSGLFYILTFIAINYMLNNFEYLFGDTNYLHFFLYKIGSFTFGVLGCFFVFGLSLNIKQQRKNIPGFIYKLDSMCFGVYLYHQFILKILYYDTGIIRVVNTPFLPWCGLVIAIVTSLALTYLTRLTKVGRYIIG